MQTLTMTDRARKVQDQIDEIDKKKQRRDFDIDSEAGGMFGTYMAYLIIIGGIGGAIGGWFVFWIIAALPPAALVTYGGYRLWQYLGYRRAKKAKAELSVAGDFIDVHEDILVLWNRQRSAVGIDAAEPRAQLDQFPNVVARLTELQVAIDNPLAKPERELLQAKAREIVTDTLVPLGDELNTVNAYERAAKEAARAADRALLQAQIQSLLTRP